MEESQMEQIDDVTADYPAVDRRTQRRRKDDTIVGQAFSFGKLAAALLASGALIGALGGAVGLRIIGPEADGARMSARIDSNVAHIGRQTVRTDSLVLILTAVQHTLETMAYIQCVQLRRSDSDLRPQGCDGAVSRQAKP